MNCQVRKEADKVSIRLMPRLDFEAVSSFRQTYTEVLSDATVTQIEIDLSEVNYLDSTGLGCLLVLRDQTQKSKRSLVLTHCAPSVLRIFKMANFQRIFVIN